MLLLIIIILLLFNGILHFNYPSKKDYPVIGVDVSSYQGNIDWKEIEKQNITFAYIKATEGSTFVDKCFEDNWKNASHTKLRLGAYHFFSFESSGKVQAENYLKNVSPINGMLPPVIDVEYYGPFKSVKDIDVQAVRTNLREMLDEIERNYGQKPIIYVTNDSYKTIVKDEFCDCDLWYRSVYAKVPDNVDWTFWQYSNRTKLGGYNGEEKFIDVNVFNGKKEDFITYPH